MEATKLLSLSLSIRCGVLGNDLISLVTVSWEGSVEAQRTKLAVLHPELGTQQWIPGSQARWETSNSVSLTLTLEQSKARNSLTNTTFCCEFVTFPRGSRVACGDLHSSDPGLSASALQGDLARILGTSGFLLLGIILMLYLLWHQKRWCHPPPAPRHRGRLSVPAWPLHMAASSPPRMDCMLWQGRDFPTRLPTSSLPQTVWSMVAWKDAREFNDRHPRFSPAVWDIPLLASSSWTPGLFRNLVLFLGL